jgi:hypothetical protein
MSAKREDVPIIQPSKVEVVKSPETVGALELTIPGSMPLLAR